MFRPEVSPRSARPIDANSKQRWPTFDLPGYGLAH